MLIISQSLIGRAYLPVKGWLCKLKQILRFIKHVLHVRRAWKHHIPVFILNFSSLPPKSGLNRMSYPFISLSTVSFTRGILLGSFRSLTLGRKRRWCNAQELVNITRQSRFHTSYMTCKDNENEIWFYLWVQTIVTNKENVKIPKWFFLILPIATVLRWFGDASEESAHPTYSRRCRGANERRMRAANPRSKSGDWWWWMSSFHCREKY